MASLNKVTLCGNLTRDPELRYSSNGKAVAKLPLAINSRYRQGDQYHESVCYIDVVVFGRQAEIAAEHLTLGSPILVEGRLNLATWEGQDGQRKSKHEVIASNVQFLPRGQGSNRQAEPHDPAENYELDDVPF